MEHEKKKKQKKKKNKQNNNHSKPNLNSESSDVDIKGVVDSDRQPINGAETSISVDVQNLNKEAYLEQKIKELQDQLDAHLQKEADLERNVSESQNERNLWLYKEADLETRILQLETEKDSWLKREAGYVEKLSRLVEEASTLRSTGKSAAETIASLNKDNARLQAQVMELEASGNDICHQNQQLKEDVSRLQLKIQELENSERTMHDSEKEDLNSQLESAQALVKKLVAENEVLKVKEKSVVEEDPNPIIVTNSEADESPEMDPMPSSAENLLMSESESDKQVVESKLMRLKSKSMKMEDILMNASVSSSGDEIVQIPLEEKSTISEVPLTEAPLIGAPFRLISFVARYVSGADLVQKNQEM